MATTGPEPITAPPPKYNPDPAVTGYVPPAQVTPPVVVPPAVAPPAVKDQTPVPAMNTLVNLPDFPNGLALVSLVATGLSVDDVSQCFIAFHRMLATSKADTPLAFHWPPAAPWFEWRLINTNARPIQWWSAMALPFTAHAQPAAACWLHTFKFPGDPLPTSRQAVKNGAPYDLNVDKTLTDGGGVTWLRVWPSPELWILALEAQP